MARAIIAGRGQLPAALHAADPASLLVRLEGVPVDIPKGARTLAARFEMLGQLFSDLRAAGIDQVAFAGGMDRPSLDPSAFDTTTARLAPDLSLALQHGDDGLLRKVIEVFEAEGFKVVGAADIAPGLTAVAGVLAGPAPDATMSSDAARARSILAALGPLDVGQATVAAGGQCLGIETLQGTDALLAFVAATTPTKRPPGGVLAKWPKPGQDLRVDMPAIGPDTIAGAAAAGLKGIAIAAGGVLILERDKTIAGAKAAGISLWAEDGGP